MAIEAPAQSVQVRQPEKIDKPVKSKTKLKIAGAIAGGIAVLGGVGAVYATTQHESDSAAAAHEQVPSGFTEHLKAFSENPAPVKRLTAIPPGRENIQENLPPANSEGKLPEINPYIQHVKSPGKEEIKLIPFSNVFTFRLEEKPTITQTIKVFTPEHPDGTMIEAPIPRIPHVYAQGYVFAKEQTANGSVLIAVGIPKDVYKLFSNEDLDKPDTTQIEPTHGNEIISDGEYSINNIIVWFRMPNLADYQQPLRPNLGWSFPDKNGVRSVMNDTTDPNEIFEYIKIGDAVYAGGYTPFSSNDRRPETLGLNYQNKKGRVPYEEAKQLYLDLANQNMAIVRKMLEDVKTGNISLREQLETKKYIINADYLQFVVGN